MAGGIYKNRSPYSHHPSPMFMKRLSEAALYFSELCGEQPDLW